MCLVTNCRSSGVEESTSSRACGHRRLGGVGAWIADFVVKADPREVHGWDYDCIEPKNIIRMPGGLDPNVWIGRPKADWFRETYSIIHTNVHGHNVRVLPENVQEVIEKTTFAFVAVDDADDRMMVCDTLANAGIPFVVVDSHQCVRKSESRFPCG